MVSGFVTSPYDQEWIASGEARLIRIASKLLTSSTRPRSDRSPREYPRPPPPPPLPPLPLLIPNGRTEDSPETSRTSAVDIAPPYEGTGNRGQGTVRHSASVPCSLSPVPSV